MNSDLPEGQRCCLYDAAQLELVIKEMAGKISVMVNPSQKLALVGILRRGAPLAHRICESLVRDFHRESPLRIDLSIKRYSDDLKLLYPHTQLTEDPVLLDLDLSAYRLVLVDDVFYTGHSLLRAVEWLNAKRPMAIYAAVLVDRHVRELPMQANIVGLHLQVAPSDVVECHVPPYEDKFQIQLLKLESKQQHPLEQDPQIESQRSLS